MVPFDGEYQLLSKSYLIIVHLLSLFSSYSHLKIRDHENVGQGHDVQRSEQRHLMTNSRLPIG